MIVLDASFLVKLVITEEGSDKARKLMRQWVSSGEHLVVTEQALLEALNAIWKHSVKTGEIGEREALEAAEDLMAIWSKLDVIPVSGTVHEAFRLAMEERITVYDAAYLSLAMSRNAGLATFDKKLSKAASRKKVMIIP